jgi:tRNA(Ile)-lysidine synthase
MDVVSAVSQAILENALIAPGETVLLALSGGADSMALLHVLCALREEFRYTLLAAHVHHGLRETADRDAAFCVGQCEKLGIRCFLHHVDTKSRLAQTGESLEEAARTLRYRALFDAADECGAIKIVLAHHKDDQAETVLLHLLRGSGMEGLCGMAPKNGRLIRPLLTVEKNALLVFCKENAIPFVRDETNEDRRFLRNRIRLSLLPALREYNPNITDALCRSAALLSAENDLLSDIALKSFRRLSQEQDGGIAFDSAALNLEPLALKRRVLRIALARLGGLKNLRLEHVDGVLSLKSGSLPLPGGLRALRSGDALLLSPASAASAAWCQPLSLPGVTQTPAGMLLALPAKERLPVEASSLTQFVAAAALKGAHIRNRRQGDFIRPFGLHGTKKLSDYFIDRKIPRWQRDRLPLICKGSEVFWAVGCGISEALRLQGGPCLQLTFTPGEGE